MKTSSVFAALAAVCTSFAWADTPRDVAPEGVFKDGSVILFIGDSITHGGRRGDMNHYIGHGYQAEIAARYLGYRPDKGLCFLNRAISGDTAEKLLKRWENDVFNLKFMEKGWQSPFPERTGTLKPDVVSLLVGINDFYQAKSGKMTLEKYAANLEMLVSSTLKKFPGVEMVLCEPFCLREPEKGQLAPWRKAAREVAERHNLCFVDFQKLYDETLIKENARPGYWYWDGAHPTYAAHIRMADYWIEKVSEHHRRTVYSFTVKGLKGEDVPLANYKGKVLLVVNTATRCGFTPQYNGLEAMYERLKDKGFELLDFPCNQFGAQAPGTEDEIHAFCVLNYKTAFPQFAKVEVNGENAAPLFKFLTANSTFEGFPQDGKIAPILEKMLAKADPDYAKKPDIKWNFTKFLIGRDGRIIRRFEPTAPLSEVEEAARAALEALKPRF